MMVAGQPGFPLKGEMAKEKLHRSFPKLKDYLTSYYALTAESYYSTFNHVFVVFLLHNPGSKSKQKDLQTTEIQKNRTGTCYSSQIQQLDDILMF